jgi:NAD(P)-dependent dehydrogenase (short-subunit alcohol dehydrogenase family)
MGVYNVSKHAVVSLSETLYHDLQLIKAPITASVLCPYFVPTGISRSERNRPEELKSQTAPTASQRVAQAASDKAVSSGKVSAAEVAERTFDAIRDGVFYIYSHPHALGNVHTRMEDILLQRNPSDPFVAAPHIRDMLVSKLNAD